MAQLLTDNGRCVIPIVGMEGVGKTALAMLIYNSKTIKSHFPHRHWVDIPSNCNAEELLEVIKVKIKRKQTSKSYRCLVVVDDARTTVVWDTLKEAFPNTLNPTKILLTTRNVDVAVHANPEDIPHRLQLLSDDDSWALFARTLTIPQEVLEQCRKAVMECGGLPRSIVELREQFVHLESNSQWSEVLVKLNLDNNPWLETLKVIEKRGLPLNLRQCLFYFGLFPANFEIPIRRLVLLWIAEGLVRLRRDDEDPTESVADRYLTDLIDRNMVQVTKRKLNGEVKKCRLPYPLQKTVLSEAKRDILLVGRLFDHFNRKDVPIFSHIHGDTPKRNLLRRNYKHLLSFLSFDTRKENKAGEDAGNFLERCIHSGCFQSLRVLDLECVFRPKLPEALGNLIRLRYLGLRWTCLQELPLFISELLNLQTIDVKHTQISTLPKSIWKMQQLRHLYMDESYRCRFVPRPRRCSLTNLQTLWGGFIDEDSPLKEGLDTITNLIKLGLQCRLISSQEQAMSSQLEAVADWVLKLVKIKYLRIKSFNKNGEPCDLPLKSLSKNTSLKSLYLLGKLTNPSIISEFPENLTDITLSASRLTEDPMQSLQDLPNLRCLQLLSKSYTGMNMRCSSGGFTQLRVLKLWILGELESWVVEEGALSSLRDLEIRSCTSLNMLPDGLRHVRSLKEFKISDMPEKFQDRVKVNQGQDWDKIAHVPYFYLDDVLVCEGDTDKDTESFSNIKWTRKASQIWMQKIEEREMVFLNRIASGTLEAEFPVGSIECPFCGTEPESEAHVFFFCKVVKMIWFSKWGFRTDDFSHLSISNWISHILNPSLIFGASPPEETNLLHFAVILMRKTWQWRNIAIIEGFKDHSVILRETFSDFTKAYARATEGRAQSLIIH